MKTSILLRALLFGAFLLPLSFLYSCKEKASPPLNLPSIDNQSFEILENTEVESIIGTVQASGSNSDEDISFEITGGNSLNAFLINSISGEISVLNREALDFETLKEFLLEVTVASSLDKTVTSTAVITISLLDVISPPTNNLFAYYPFNGNADNEAGNLLDGIVMFNPQLTSDRNDEPNSAFSFDGIDDYINLGDSSIFNIANHSAYSMSFWIRPTSTLIDVEHVVLGLYSSTNDSRINKVGIRTSPGNIVVYKIYDLGTSTHETIQGNYTIGLWQHVVLVAAGNVVKLYINNVEQDAQIVNISSLQTVSNLPMFIGAVLKSNSSPDLYFEGVIDDVAFYSGALTEDEINILYRE